MDHFVEISLITVVVSIPVLILITILVYGVRDTCIFSKTLQWPDWQYIEKSRMVVKRESGNYYELSAQGLFLNVNDKRGKLKWLFMDEDAPGTVASPLKLVTKNSVTIDKEGVAHFHAPLKDPVEI